MASNDESDAVTMDKLQNLIQKMNDELRNDIRNDMAEMKDEMKAINAKLDGNTIEMNQRFAAVDERFVKSEAILESTKEQIILIENSVNERITLIKDEVNRIELTLENNETESYSGTPTTTDYECTETMNSVVFSEQLVIEEQSNLEIVNDMEVDWDEDIVFDHSNIESKPIVTEQQLTEVKCMFFHSKYSSESLVSTTQQEVNAMKYEATDVEVFSAKVLSVETELNSCLQFEEGLPRKVWDPGLIDDIILL